MAIKRQNITEIDAHRSVSNIPRFIVRKRETLLVVDMSENPNGAKLNPWQGKLHPASSFGKVPQKRGNKVLVNIITDLVKGNPSPSPSKQQLLRVGVHFLVYICFPIVCVYWEGFVVFECWNLEGVWVKPLVMFM